MALSQDLIITEYSGKTTFENYEEFNLNLSVRNAGIVPVNSYYNVGWYLSEDSEWQESDQVIGSYYAHTLQAGASYTISPVNAFIVAEPGTYYVIVKLDYDNAITETDEINNMLAIPDFVIKPGNVDFAFTSFSLNKNTFAQYDKVNPTFILENKGSTNVGGMLAYRFLISTNTTLDENDIYTDANIVGQSLTGTDKITSSAALAFMIPGSLPPGNYYILAVADYDEYSGASYEETNETNNISALPIVVQASNIDMEITGSYSIAYSSADQGSIQGTVAVTNHGTTGVTGYRVNAQLFPADGIPSASWTGRPWGNTENDKIYIGPGQTKYLTLDIEELKPATGSYRIAVGVNFNRLVKETNYENNVYIAPGAPINIVGQSTPSIVLNQVSVPLSVDNTDRLVTVDLSLKNTGNVTSFNQLYDVAVISFEGQVLHTQQSSIAIDFIPGETRTKTITLNLVNALPAGNYQVAVTCANPCFSTPNQLRGEFKVVPTQFTLSGHVQGEDGVPINKGKLFLYRKEITGEVRFTQKYDPVIKPDFTFLIGGDPYTLYFIPDPVEYPDYVPTILGKTVVLQQSNFFTATENKNVIIEVLKVQSLAEDDGIIHGRLIQEEQTSSRLSGSIASVPILLLSTSGQVVGVTYTDTSGNFEFNHLPRDSYQILASFELDDPTQMDPYSVDITSKNAQVDILLTPEDITTVVSPLLLSQTLTFNEFSAYRYGDGPIDLVTQSDAGLMVTYSSSDERVASILDGRVVIKGVGEVTIIASQSGNAFYLPSTVSRKLVVNKALQNISFPELTEQLSNVGTFTLQALTSSGLPVAFESSDPSTVSIEGTVATVHKHGVLMITAHQSGNSNYEKAESVARKLVVQLVTAIEPIFEAKDIYPNPTGGVVYLRIPGINQVEISDMMGHVQSQISLDGETLDFSLMPAGIYIVKITTQNKTITEKVFKR